MKTLLGVFIAGGIGSAVRYGLGQRMFLKNMSTNYFYLPTLLVNLIGSFLIGIIMAYAAKNITFDTDYKLILATGFCGGFTTFSALSNEAFLMLKENNVIGAVVYIGITITFGLLATWMGYKLNF